MAGDKNVNLAHVLSETSLRDEKGVMRTLSEQETPANKVLVSVTLKLGVKMFKLVLDLDDSAKEFCSEGVSSPLFPRAVWKLQVLPKWGNTTSWLNLHLTGPMASHKETLGAIYHIYLVGAADGGIDSVQRDSFKFGKDESLSRKRESRQYSVGAQVSHDRMMKALQPDGSLLVAAAVEFLAPDDGAAKAIAVDEGDLIKWQATIGKLRETEANSDCTIVVGGEELKAHRLILSAISPIFERMFGNQGFQQARDGIVRMEDPPGMLQDTSAMPVIPSAALLRLHAMCIDWTLYGDCKRDVLVVACKYLVLDLKHYVERLLARDVTVDAFTEMAILYDTYSCEILKKACLEFLTSNRLAVVLTPQWENLTKTRGDLASELLRQVRETKAAAAGGGSKRPAGR